MSAENIYPKIFQLLQDLISTQSFSREEENAAQVIRDFFNSENISYETRMNNTWAYNHHFDASKPTLLLNSHIDTVKPSALWTKDPFSPIVEDGKLYGLGSNDAGGALVCLIGAFLYFNAQENLPFNICVAATAEEEISGQNGIASISDVTNECNTAIVGEPTEMEMATAERGLMVIDATVHGVAGHAARDTGVNSIYKAIEDIEWFKTHQLEKQCPVLGPTKMTVTVIEAGKQHNVVPDVCKYVIDVRTTAAYEYEELVQFISENIHADLKPRSTRLQPSIIDKNHPIVQAAEALKINTFGSATLSDQALLKIPSIKMGPGKSERSHTADEFIFVSEIEQGLKNYIQLIENISCLPTKKSM
ncbi:MAG TPA: M20/M25/M40 family metallo-hydrolase [Chitinophagales bacterium]|nr:M20/M25/M40 family metallo-hydrolase [Chitinophagales bacterium]